MDHFSPSAACAEFAADLSYDSIPPEALDLIRRDILDWTGCALAGSRDRAAVPIQKTAELLGGKAEASVFGNRDKTDLRTAAMENGYFGHIFEMDDVDRESISHPATVVMPGAMALGEWQKKTGRDVLTAIVAGFEVMLRIGAAITPAHYAIWHTTSTAGVFGAAAASGRMLGLTNQQMQWALGNAGTLACGLWQFNPDGAMSKFLHAGNAAGNGILVSLMAQNGFSGATHILEGKQGFFAGYARQSVNFDLFRDFGRVWRSAIPAAGTRIPRLTPRSRSVSSSRATRVTRSVISRFTRTAQRFPSQGRPRPLRAGMPSFRFPTASRARFSAARLLKRLSLRTRYPIRRFPVCSPAQK